MVEMMRNIFRWAFEAPPTRLYPFETRPTFEGARGAIDMDPDVCIYCGMCERRCPSNALKVTKKPNTWTVNPHACILCGYCVEVCPKKCIRMEREYRKPTG